jgi:hypothetical protein
MCGERKFFRIALRTAHRATATLALDQQPLRNQLIASGGVFVFLNLAAQGLRQVLSQGCVRYRGAVARNERQQFVGDVRLVLVCHSLTSPADCCRCTRIVGRLREVSPGI